MATYKDIVPAQNGWLHDLAKAEIHPEAERLLQLSRSYDPQQLVEESTVDFLTALREQFSEHARVFNALSEQGTRFQEIKVFGLAQGAADFMVFRNHIKLLISNQAHGVIQISFAQHIRGTLELNGQVQTATGAARPIDGTTLGALAAPQDFLAQIGPFRDIFWTFQGEKIEPVQVAKFFFTEFARITRDTRRSKAGNQVLIDQIKALLHEKGLDL